MIIDGHFESYIKPFHVHHFRMSLFEVILSEIKAFPSHPLCALYNSTEATMMETKQTVEKLHFLESQMSSGELGQCNTAFLTIPQLLP